MIATVVETLEACDMAVYEIPGKYLNSDMDVNFFVNFREVASRYVITYSAGGLPQECSYGKT